MPKFEVTMSNNVDRILTIEDDRSLPLLASVLVQEGHVITKDVTQYAGRSPRDKEIALFLGSVEKIVPAL
jgi:hypothetical protein